MQPYVRNAGIALVFLAGWMASSWRHDSIELVANKAAAIATQAANKDAMATYEGIQKTLTGLRSNEKVIIRENVKIVDRPVYRNLCLDPDGLRNANAAKNGFFPTP